MTEEYNKFTAEGAEVIAVVHDTLDGAQAYAKELLIPFPLLVDTEHRIYDRYQVESRHFSLGQRPGLFVIDTNGVIRYAHVGMQQWEIPKNEVVLEVCRSIPLPGRW